jgi:hypothetical protein
MLPSALKVKIKEINQPPTPASLNPPSDASISVKFITFSPNILSNEVETLSAIEVTNENSLSKNPATAELKRTANKKLKMLPKTETNVFAKPFVNPRIANNIIKANRK